MRRDDKDKQQRRAVRLCPARLYLWTLCQTAQKKPLRERAKKEALRHRLRSAFSFGCLKYLEKQILAETDPVIARAQNPHLYQASSRDRIATQSGLMSVFSSVRLQKGMTVIEFHRTWPSQGYAKILRRHSSFCFRVQDFTYGRASSCDIRPLQGRETGSCLFLSEAKRSPFSPVPIFSHRQTQPLSPGEHKFCSASRTENSKK